MENTQPTEHWFKSVLFYIPRLISSIFSALAMDDKGLSLKKCLAVAGTWEGIRLTEQWACKENAIAYLLIWLLWSGILVGIYSFADIIGAYKTYKGTDEPKKETTT